LEITRLESGWGADTIIITPDIQQQLEGCSGSRFRLCQQQLKTDPHDQLKSDPLFSLVFQ
jgi:hypothetical protein